MKNLLKKHTTFHIILLIITMHYSSNTLAMQPKKIPVPSDTIIFNEKTYIFKDKDKETINNKINYITNSQSSTFIPTFAITGLSILTTTIFGGLIGSILDTKNNNPSEKPKRTLEIVGVIFGNILGLGISYYIVVADKTINKTLNNDRIDSTNDMIEKYLEQKQEEYFASVAPHPNQ